jgi:hypothetical protein
MTAPLCDVSMQKIKNKNKKKRKSKRESIVSHIIIYWDNVGQYIFVATK